MRYFAGRQLNDRCLHILFDLAELKGLQIYNKPVGIFISVITPNSAYQTCHPEAQQGANVKNPWAQAELSGICACSKPRDLFGGSLESPYSLTKPPDSLPPYRTGSGGCSVQGFPIDIFPFCRERPVTKEPGVL